jgi:hypothetical protein
VTLLNRALFNRWLLTAHRWLAIAIGAQVLLWVASGLFMSWFPIETIRGAHLRKPETQQVMRWDDTLISPNKALAVVNRPVSTLSTGLFLGQPVWRAKTQSAILLVDAKTGTLISPISAELANKVAVATLNKKAASSQPVLLAEPPREVGGNGPAWRVDFKIEQGVTLYIDVSSGEVRSIRTPLWRIYDFFWGLHIMDWQTRENFNSWWLKASAAFAVGLSLIGLALTYQRINSMIIRWRHRAPTSESTS